MQAIVSICYDLKWHEQLLFYLNLYKKKIMNKMICKRILMGEDILAVQIPFFSNDKRKSHALSTMISIMKKLEITKIYLSDDENMDFYQALLSRNFAIYNGYELMWNMKKVAIKKYAKFIRKELYYSQVFIIAEKVSDKLMQLIDILSKDVKAITMPLSRKKELEEIAEYAMYQYGIHISFQDRIRNEIIINISSDAFLQQTLQQKEATVLSLTPSELKKRNIYDSVVLKTKDGKKFNLAYLELLLDLAHVHNNDIEIYLLDNQYQINSFRNHAFQ